MKDDDAATRKEGRRGADDGIYKLIFREMLYRVLVAVVETENNGPIHTEIMPLFSCLLALVPPEGGGGPSALLGD